MAEQKTPIWTPDEVRTVCQLLYHSDRWQTPLANAISIATKRDFSQSRIAKWYLDEGGRGIPNWLQPHLTPILREVARMADLAVRDAREIIERHNA